VRPLCPHSPNC